MKRSTPRPSRSCACSPNTVIAVLRRAAEWADRPGDEDVRAGHLAGVARDLHCGLVDRRDVVLEVLLGELAAVRTEGVRLDDVRAGADEAEVQREHALGRADVRLLGAAQPGDGARDERAHPAVADERGAVREALEKPAHRRIPPFLAAGAPRRGSSSQVNARRGIGQAPLGDARGGGIDQSAVTHSGQRCGGRPGEITEG